MSCDLLDRSEVAVAAGASHYGDVAPYAPGELYPEYPFAGSTLSTRPNPAYAGVRQALSLLGLDADHLHTPAWNPLREVVKPGDTVVLKPNFVRNFRETHPDHGNCIVTHGAILRAVADYVYLALRGEGRLIIADAPQNDADFTALREIAGLDAIQEFYRTHAGFELEVYDLRPECACKIDGVIVGHEPLPGDPAGYVKVNLGKHSAFMAVNHLCHLLYGAEYDMGELHRHQHDDVHEYLISKTILDADCVISVPKLKTHKKVALTVNLKNLVGINGNKNWLPHHREGTPSQGGDQFADDGMKRRLERSAVAGFKRWFQKLGPLRPVVAGPVKALGKRVFGDTNNGTIRSGNWYGNDTTWRMVADLNRILFYADREGRVHDEPVRRFFSVVDGIVGGEGNGPLDPTPRKSECVLAGFNPVAVDLVCARLMGFDSRRIPMLQHALEDHPLALAGFAATDVDVRSNCVEFNGKLTAIEGPAFAFLPHFGWEGHVELCRAEDEISSVT